LTDVSKMQEISLSQFPKQTLWLKSICVYL